MSVLPSLWVVYFLAGLTFLLTWLFFALLNIMSPTLMFTTIDHVDHRNHSNHLDHRNQMSQTHASTGINLLLVNMSLTIKAVLTAMITMTTLKPRCWPRCCSSLTSQDGLEQSLVGSSLAF